MRIAGPGPLRLIETPLRRGFYLLFPIRWGRVTAVLRYDVAMSTNVDAQELAKFSELAHRWWDPDSEFRPLHQINPLRLDWIDDPRPVDAIDARIQSSGIALSLSSALLLYDNYLSAIALYRADNGLRQHLNRADKAFDLQEGRLNRIALSFASPLNRLRVRRALRWFDENGYDLAGGDEGYRYLVQLIEQSPARNIVREVQPVQFVGRLAGFFSAISFDTLMELKDQGVFVPSMLFGNAVGLVESRRGKLDAQPELEARVSGALRAGDILLEKTPFRLTDSF